MKIATWNVNSIKVRLDHAKNWVETNHPDVLMIQELKGEAFPSETFQAIGYNAEFVGQKAYNGVAVLSPHPINVILNRLPGDDADEQARYLEVEVKGLRLINIYLPNGNPVDSEKFPYKLQWMARLKDRLAHLRREGIVFAVGGDFNVIPEPEDCHDPKAWENDALFRPESRAAFRALLWLGLTDALRVVNNAPRQYTYWDYQAGAWPADKGIRIDHFLLSPTLTDRLQDCVIDRDPRALDKASDHTPLVMTID
ncbi:exodeoxyribonuclease III [Micavibrio aeruginosavorus]|uniref:Exodeoxyribonuclease III n=1 Tax=Micavibrio aeruginosavorus (strain ARL-13) TaxID=856793 RepID=G2KN30_MICAA|nr:exodeoxyribonuclease III [Micavibrio aeruginosavorus]AEP08962.1 exodeoxyribonuclease III [Micavibrio aeruginosavorus ARL-13]